MSKITAFDRAQCAVLRTAIESKLKEVADELGITLTAGNIRFDKLKATVTLDAKIVDAAGAAASDKATWDQCCHFWGLTSADFGKVFSSQGRMYRITGCNPNAPRYPINGVRIPDGKSFRFPTSMVKMGLPKAPPASIAA